jgi:hypothetical protein
MNPSPIPARFTSAHGRATIVKILLVIGAITAALLLVVEALSFVFPMPADEEEFGEATVGVLVMLMVFLLSILATIIYLVTVVFFCMWLYRAYDNLRAFNPWARLEYSPGWAVGSFFIPFVNLVLPYKAVREVWEKSGHPDEAFLYAPSPPAWFHFWWAFWLLSNFAGNISFRVSFSENADVRTSMMVDIVASALAVVAALFAYIVVDAIDKRQEETSGKVKLGDYSGPPPPPASIPLPDAVAPAP